MFKKAEVISSIFFDHKGMKLKINYRKKTRKSTNMCRLNTILVTNWWVTEEIKKEIEKYLEKN